MSGHTPTNSTATSSTSPGRGSDQDRTYLDIIHAAVSAATDAGAAPPPAANTNLADLQRRLSSDPVHSNHNGGGNSNHNGGGNSNHHGGNGAGPPIQPLQPRSSSAESYPLSAGESSASPLMEPDFYGTLNDEADADAKPAASAAAAPDGEAGYVRRRGIRPDQRQQRVQRAGSVGDINFGHPVDQRQQMGMGGGGGGGMPLPSGSASVDGAMAFPTMDFEFDLGGGDPFGPPLGPPPPYDAPPGNIDVSKRRHSTGDLDIDSDLDDYDILDLAPAYVGSNNNRSASSLSPDVVGTHSSQSNGAATPSSVASTSGAGGGGQPRRAPRRPSGDLATTTKKKPSKTVRKRGATLKKSGSSNSLSSLDGAVARLHVGAEAAAGGSGGSLDSPLVGAGAASAKKAAAKDKKPRSWKKPKDKPKRPLSAYNLFFQHERARIVHGGDGAAADGGATGAAAAAPAAAAEATDSSGRKKRRHRTAHGKIGFAALAQTIAARWKTLPASERTVFEQRAGVEKERYRREMEVWNKAQKEKRLTEQREQLKQYQEERLRQEVLAKQEEQMKVQQMMAAQRQQLQSSMQAQGHPMPQDHMMGGGGGGGMDQVQSNAQIQQQMMMMQQQQQQQQQQMGDSMSSLGGGFGQQHIQMQPQAVASMGGNALQQQQQQQQQQNNDVNLHNMNTNQMSMMSSNMLMNNMGGGQAPQQPRQQPQSSQDEIQMQQAAKLKQIQQAQQILQMQAMAIKRQQQAQGGATSDFDGGQNARHVPDNPEFYQGLMKNFQGAGSGGYPQAQPQADQGGMGNAAMQQMEMMAQMGNSSFNSLGGGDISNANQQQMQQLMMQQQMMQQQMIQQQQQQAFSNPGAQVSIPLNDAALNDNVFDDVATNEELMRVLGAPGNDFGGDDDASDEALKEMLNNFDVGNLDSLGFEFDPNGQSR